VDRALLIIVVGVLVLANFKKLAIGALTLPWRLFWRLVRRKSQ
jgi:hypothetical protein